MLTVHVACNDLHGRFDGQAERIEILDLEGGCEILIDLAYLFEDETRAGAVFAFDDKAGTIMIDGRTYPVGGHGTWVGNWCWDAWAVEDDVARLIVWDCLHDVMTFEGGPLPLWCGEMAREDWWEPAMAAWRESYDRRQS